MAWFRWRFQGVRQCLVAGAACGLTAGVLFAEDGPQFEAAARPEIASLKPDEDLGPIYRLPETPLTDEAGDAPDWKPNWRQPSPARSTRRTAPNASDPLAPPEIDLPGGTEAPPIEPEATKQGSSRRRHGGTRTTDSSPSAPLHSPSQSAHPGRAARVKSGKPAHVTTSEAPVEVEIPGLDNLDNSATLPEPTYPANPKDTQENSAPRRGFMSRIFRSSPPSPASETSRPTRAGWGGLFRNGPVSR